MPATCSSFSDAGTLTTRVKITQVAHSGGMIIQHYEFAIRCDKGRVYEGNTTFGFFSKAALAQQVGIRDAKLLLHAGMINLTMGDVPAAERYLKQSAELIGADSAQARSMLASLTMPSGR